MGVSDYLLNFADVIQSISNMLHGMRSNRCCMFCLCRQLFIKSRIKKEIIMEMLTILFAIAAIIGVGLVIWMKYTESGKKWVEGEY